MQMYFAFHVTWYSRQQSTSLQPQILRLYSSRDMTKTCGAFLPMIYGSCLYRLLTCSEFISLIKKLRESHKPWKNAFSYFSEFKKIRLTSPVDSSVGSVYNGRSVNYYEVLCHNLCNKSRYLGRFRESNAQRQVSGVFYFAFLFVLCLYYTCAFEKYPGCNNMVDL